MELAPAWRREYPEVGRQEVDAAQLLSEPCRCYLWMCLLGLTPRRIAWQILQWQKTQIRQASSERASHTQNYDKHQIGKGSLSKNSTGWFPVPFFWYQAFLTHTKPERQSKDLTLFGWIILGSLYLFKPIPLKLHGQHIASPLWKWSLEPYFTPVGLPPSQLSGCVTLGKWFEHSVPRFSQMQDGDPC